MWIIHHKYCLLYHPNRIATRCLLSSPLSKSFTLVKVFVVFLVTESFAFKRYAAISGACVEHQAIDPLYKVEQIEADIAQLSHLCCAYLLVVDSVRRQALALASEDNSEEVNRRKSLKGNNRVVDQFHNS